MINFNLKNKKGFTLVETMVAIFILSVSLVGIIGMISRSYLSAMYSKNEITATYLIQEAVDYIRNDRDTSVILKGGDWDTFSSKYTSSCTKNDGCYIDVLNSSNPTTCPSGDCPYFRINSDGYYTYIISDSLSNFKREIIVEKNSVNPDQLDITVKVEWKNGNLVRSRNLHYNLLNWNK